MKLIDFALTPRLLLIVAILLLSGCAGYKLKPAGPTKVGNMEFESSMTWNQVPSRLGPNTEVWTADGVLLNQFIFVTGVDNGEGLFSDVNKDTPMPKFRSKAMPHELKTLVETSLTNTSGGLKPIIGNNLRPRKIAGTTGIEFDLEFFNADGLLNRGKVLAFVSGGKFYSVIFWAASTYHYEQYGPEFEAIVKTLRV